MIVDQPLNKSIISTRTKNQLTDVGNHHQAKEQSHNYQQPQSEK